MFWKYNRFSCFENCKSFCNLLKCRHYYMIIFHSRDIAKFKMFLKLFLTFCWMSNFSDIHFVAVQLLFPNISMHSNKENAFIWICLVGKELHFVYHVRHIILYAHMCLHFSFPHDFRACNFPHKLVSKAIIVSVQTKINKRDKL